MFIGDTKGHNPHLHSCKAPEEKLQNAMLLITVIAVQVAATCSYISEEVQVRHAPTQRLRGR